DVSCWITFTNGNDRVNNQRYFDKGFSLAVPLDIFMNKSSKTKTCFKMSQWLRDVGAKANTGKDLYSIIHNERYFP
ncbi:MAG: YjbH domain-containing protein, partial [Parachlamydiales bacterium]